MSAEITLTADHRLDYYVIHAESADGVQVDHLFEKPHILTLAELVGLAFNVDHFDHCVGCYFCMFNNDPRDRGGAYDCPGLDGTCEMYVGHGGPHSPP